MLEASTEHGLALIILDTSFFIFLTETTLILFLVVNDNAE